jgi:hypothetical protein
MGAIATIGIFSILWRENRLYRFFEHLFIGVACGYLLCRSYIDVIKPMWWNPIVVDGAWWRMFPFFIALMYYFVYSRKYSWVAKLLIGFMFGLTAGDTVKAFVTRYSPQLGSSFKPLIVKAGASAVDWQASFSSWVFLVVLLCVISYFFFSIEHKHFGLKTSSKLGRWFIMVYLGAIFGTTVMGRMSLLISRLLYLFRDWIPLVKV